MNLPKLQVDECPDANGNFTIRPYDGSPNGDIYADTIGTIYDKEQAELIVRTCNYLIDRVKLEE